MHIALISADFMPNVGGVAAHVAGLGGALAALGHSVHIVTLPLGAQRAQESTWRGMTVHRPNLPKIQPLYYLLLERWLQRLLAHTPVDIIHVHGLRPLQATRHLKLPVLFTNHTSGFLRRLDQGIRQQRRLAARMAHLCHVIAPSAELAAATQKVGFDGPVTFIPNGVDTEIFQPGPTAHRKQWNVAAGETVVLLARRLVDKNGVTVFAAAAADLHDLPVRLVFAGDGPERDKVSAMLRRAHMLDRALFLGNVPNADMPDIYRAADLSVLPSFMEATSITGLESMACGLPLVGTRVGGIPDLIEEGASGLLVPPGDPAALESAMRTLILDPARRQAMGARARARAIERFSWTRIAADTLTVYEQHIRKMT